MQQTFAAFGRSRTEEADSSVVSYAPESRRPSYYVITIDNAASRFLVPAFGAQAVDRGFDPNEYFLSTPGENCSSGII